MLRWTKCLTLLTTVSMVAGCGGLDLRKGLADDKSGYQLYYPKILVTVSAERRCISPDAKGECPDDEWKHNCLMSKPWVLPDYNKPYVAKFKKGVGSQSATIEIVDGWMLGRASSATDVSAITSTLFELASEDASAKCKEGVHEWTADGFKEFPPP